MLPEVIIVYPETIIGVPECLIGNPDMFSDVPEGSIGTPVMFSDVPEVIIGVPEAIIVTSGGVSGNNIPRVPLIHSFTPHIRVITILQVSLHLLLVIIYTISKSYREYGGFSLKPVIHV